jgi:hypothetical protein
VGEGVYALIEFSPGKGAVSREIADGEAIWLHPTLLMEPVIIKRVS